MAFCPNCGTPNTDQAEKCVACGFEIIVPKQKAKFKGTIMMSGIKAPAAPEPAQTPPGPPAPPSPQAAPPSSPPPPPPGTGRNLSYQKTILGPSGFAPPPGSGTSPSLPGTPPSPPSDTSFSGAGASARADSPSFAPSDTPRAATIQGPGPQLGGAPASSMTDLGSTRETPLASAHGMPPSPQFTSMSAPTEGAGFSQQGAGGRASFSAGKQPSFTDTAQATGSGFGATSGFGGTSTLPPARAKSSPGKLVALGCAGLLVLVLALGLTLYFVFRDKVSRLFQGGSDPSADAAAWQVSISQALTQVAELCKSDCQSAAIFFHPDTQKGLLGQAKALTPERVKILGDTAQSQAAMLDGTDDGEIATKLSLDPQQCARVVAKDAKVVSCSVPNPDGTPSLLRIVHLSGIDSL